MRKCIVMVIAAALVLAAHLFRGGAEATAAQPPAVPQTTSRLAALRQERVAIARRALELLEQQFRSGLGEDAEIAQWQRRLFEAETAAAADKAGRVAAAERYVDATRKRMERTQRLSDAARVGAGTMLAVKYDLAGAECALEELKAQ